LRESRGPSRVSPPFLSGAGAVNGAAPAEGAGAVELWPRHREILCLVALTNLEIALRLGIGRQTVKNHLTDAYGRLGIHGHTSANGKRVPGLLRALALGLVTLDEIEPPPQRLPPGWCSERFAQIHTARWREWKRCTGLT